jgi:hypothetical protein
MKRLKSKSNSTITKTLASSILLASCTPSEDFYSHNYDENYVNQSKGAAISLYLDDKTKEMLINIAPLVQEIIDNPEIAEEISNDPVSFCKARGYSFTINLDDAIFRVITALGNKDINDALKNNDFEEFIRLCSENGLLDEKQGIALNTMFRSDEDQEIFYSIAKQLNGVSIETRSVALVIAVSVVLVIAIVLTYTIGLDYEEEILPGVDNVPQELATVNRNDFGMRLSPQPFIHNAKPDYSVLDVWALKNKKTDTYQLVSKYKSLLAEQIISYLKKEKPEVFDNFSEMQISEFLKRNMIV